MHPNIEIITCNQGITYLTRDKPEATPSYYDTPESLEQLPHIVLGGTQCSHHLYL